MTHHAMNRIVACAAAGLVLSACGTPYQPAPGEVLAPDKLVGIGSPRMCKDGKIYTLNTEARSETVKVPVGQRIAIGSHMYFDGGYMTYTCNAFLSFVPEAGKSYVSNSGLREQQRCFIELVREDPVKETGVVLEPSVGPAYCGTGK